MIVAAVHGVIMGIVLAGMGVPLWAPLAVLIFLASFIPIVGIFFAGGLATLVTLGAKGPIYALVFVGILVVEQQLENHVLQPLIVGRAVNFHPLAIILVLAVGGVLAGIAGRGGRRADRGRALPGAARAVPQAGRPARPRPAAGPGDGPPAPPRPAAGGRDRRTAARPAAGRPRGQPARPPRRTAITRTPRRDRRRGGRIPAAQPVGSAFVTSNRGRR